MSQEDFDFEEEEVCAWHWKDASDEDCNDRVISCINVTHNVDRDGPVPSYCPHCWKSIVVDT